MLRLNVKRGEYIVIGDSTVVQVLPDGGYATLLVDAPREVSIWRGTVLEKQGIGRPETIFCEIPKKRNRRSEHSIQRSWVRYNAKLTQRETVADAMESIQRLLDGAGDERLKSEVSQQLDRIRPLIENGISTNGEIQEAENG